jgi:hypothetical protein
LTFYSFDGFHAGSDINDAVTVFSQLMFRYLISGDAWVELQVSLRQAQLHISDIILLGP